MKRTTLKVFLGAFLLLALASCRSAPVVNVETTALGTSSNATLTQVNTAINKAGLREGWSMRQVGPGHVEGRLAIRSHVAITDIRFDTKTMSIVYKDSVNLHYDAANGIIHKNYNVWIEELRRSIIAETTGL